MVAAVAAAAALACAPHPGLGTVTYIRGAQQHSLDLETCRERVAPAQRVGRASVFVSPDGNWRAAVRRSRGTQTIWVTARGRRPFAVLTLPAWTPNGRNGSPGPIMLLGWSGDSRWIFYAIDPQGSASLVADGIELRAIPVQQEGGIRRIGVTLAYDDYRTWCGGRLVLTSGGDRIATHNKRLVVTAPPAWKPRALVRAPARAWGSLVCAKDDRSVVVQSQRASTDANFFHTHWSLWRVGLDGKQTQLTSPPPGFADEAPHLLGDTVFFVRSRNGRGSLYALRSGKLLGPLASFGYSLGYYGHNDWNYGVRR